MAHILVIDDDPTIRMVLRRSLQTQGHEVSVAQNGAEGVDLAQKFRPGLIICDWMMPVLDGLQVCHQVKNDATLSTTFFILLTARGALEDRVHGLDMGADDFLAKPIDLNELKARVRAGLRLYQVAEALRQKTTLLEAAIAEARDYVQSLLPLPMDSPLKVEARFIPSQQLGGDCFDYFWLDSDYLAMYLLDMSGHGLGAALPSISILNLLRSQSLKGVNFYQPNQVLNALNETFQMHSQGDKYFTIWYGVYSRLKQQLFYASAGHPPALLVSEQGGEIGLQLLKTPALPIGMFPNVEYEMARCRIQEPSSLYIISDGLYEFKTLTGDFFTLNELIQLIESHHLEGSIDLNLLLQDLRQHTAKGTFDDDVSMVRIHFG